MNRRSIYTEEGCNNMKCHMLVKSKIREISSIKTIISLCQFLVFRHRRERNLSDRRCFSQLRVEAYCGKIRG